ncbi:MAG: DUF362 domain-containing protein [Promethearchaeota archaeon]
MWKKKLRKDSHSNHTTNRKKTWKKILRLVGVFGLFNFLWLLLRSGFKPSRLKYPCQQAALNNFLFSLKMVAPSLAITTSWKGISSISKKAGTLFIVGIVVSSGISYISSFFPREVSLDLKYSAESAIGDSEIFVVNGRSVAHIENLIELMGDNDLKFYQSTFVNTTQGPDGLFNASDVILLKNNCQWNQRGGTNTDLIKELIQIIVDHPDGFTGEIIIADNGQGRGSMDYLSHNAEDDSQSTEDVAQYFADDFDVSTFLLDTIRNDVVAEYSSGNTHDGYVKNYTADPETGIWVTYPKFQTIFGTNVSLKRGIWNGTEYIQDLKIINLPVLKSHSGFGVTACIKNYMGVQSQGVGNGHNCVGTGGMGTLMADYGIPTLNILDAIWVNANPVGGPNVGPGTSNLEATRINVIMASLDPVALDYWAGKNVLMETAILIGNEEDCDTMDPDTTEHDGFTQAFGVYLNRSRDEILAAGYNVTSTESEIVVYGETNISIDVPPTNPNYTGLWIGLGVGGALMVTAGFVTFFMVRKKRHASKLI